MYRGIARNAASNWAGFAVQVAVAFLLTPFVLAKLGDARYGAWTLIMGLTGYYGLLDLGFRAGLTQYLTRHLAVRDFARMNEAASTGFVALSGCGVLIFAGSLGLAWAAPHVFRLPPGVGSEVRWALVINGAAIAIQFALFPCSAVLTATQRFGVASAIGVATRLATAAGTVACLGAGGGLVGLCLVIGGCNLLDYGLRVAAARRVLPELSISPSRASRAACWAFLHFGLWNVAINASTQMISYSDELVIGLFMSTAAIAPYALAVGLANHFASVFVPIGVVFFPAATGMDARGDTEALRRLYLAGSRIMLLMAASAALASAALADDFFRLWVGPRWSGSGGPGPALLFRVLVAGAACTAAQRIGYQVLLGMRRVKLLSALFACEAVANLVLSLALVPRFGLIGVAAGTLIPAVICQGILQPFGVCRTLGISLGRYAREIYPIPLAATAVLGVLLLAALPALPTGGWGPFAQKASAVLAMAVGSILLVGLDGALRRHLPIGLLRRPGPLHEGSTSDVADVAARQEFLIVEGIETRA